MVRYTLWAIAALHLATAAIMWFAPHDWYLTVPGVTMTGPYNSHFVRDIALVFLVSGVALGIGVWRGDVGIAMVGAAWPCLHGLFHMHMWVMRGLPLDEVALVNLVGIQCPAWITLFLVLKHRNKEI